MTFLLLRHKYRRIDDLFILPFPVNTQLRIAPRLARSALLPLFPRTSGFSFSVGFRLELNPVTRLYIARVYILVNMLGDFKFGV